MYAVAMLPLRLLRPNGCHIDGQNIQRCITLSPVQAQRANDISRQQGLGERLSFQVAGGCRVLVWWGGLGVGGGRRLAGGGWRLRHGGSWLHCCQETAR